jgi:hypothetical protein
VFLLLLLLAAGGGWFWWHRRAPAPAAAQGPQAPAAPGALVLASAAGPARPAAAAATEVQAARVTAFQWGGVGKDSTADLAARGDGRLVLTGLIADRSSIPAADLRISTSAACAAALRSSIFSLTLIWWRPVLIS